MRKKWIILISALVLTALVIASVPRIKSRETISLTELENGAFPALLEEYRREQAQYDLVPVGYVKIVTIGNLWGSVRHGFIPCVYSQVNTVPKHGITNWATRLCVVSTAEGSRLVRRLYRWNVENVHVYSDIPDDTMVYSEADVYPGGVYDHTTGVTDVDCPNSAMTSAVGVTFTVCTSAGAEVSSEDKTARFIWDFDLVLCGETIVSCRDFAVEYDYINNAS